MTFSRTDQQFLPLDSTIKPFLIFEHSKSLGNESDSLSTQQGEISLLMTKISQLEKNFIDLQRKYTKKIKQLKQQLLQKHNIQHSLSQQLLNLSKQYEKHKQQIQKISSEIKKSLENNLQKHQRQTKIKSVSSKNHANNSPKRLIKKSLEIVKNQHLQSKRQIISKEFTNSQQKNHTSTQNIKTKKIESNTNATHQSKMKLIIDQQRLKISNENSLDASNQTKNERKLLNSPSNQSKGPSPKKNLLFNSSKQLDLFGKPVNDKKITLLPNSSPPRRINISPKQKIKQKLIPQNKQENSEFQVISQKIVKEGIKQTVKVKQIYGIKGQTSSPTHRKKISSPQSLELSKRFSNKPLTIKTELKISLNLKTDSQKPLVIEKPSIETNQEYKNIKNIHPQLNCRKGQIKIGQQKKMTKSPIQQKKYIKNSPESKFSPLRKLKNNSPTHKKEQFGVGIKPKLLGSMREKFDDNLFR